MRGQCKWSVAAACVTMMLAAPTYADTWNERTVLTFSEPVMIPAATLAPGEYEFRLADSRSNRHTVRVLATDGATDVMATTQAVPLKRADASSEAGRASTGAREPSETTAPMAQGALHATRVELDALEDRPREYIGRTISVDAEVEEVFGPRLFSIDERNWGDLDGEILVFTPSHLAALVREDDRVTITGTIRPFDRAGVVNEPGWLGLGPGEALEREQKPILVASRIVGGDNESVLLVEAKDSRALTAGTRLRGEAPLTDAGTVTAGGEELIGRKVRLDKARVADLWAHGGFYVTAEGDSIFVLPANPQDMVVDGGEMVSIEGVILDAPGDLALRGDAPDDANTEIYILSTRVQKG